MQAMQAWLDAGGDLIHLKMYQALGAVTPIADTSGRCLVFHGGFRSGFHSGAIGQFTGGPSLLSAAESVLRRLGCREAVGPLDGNTFFNYRCTLSGGTPLPLEPAATPEVWRSGGYREDARYVSILVPNADRVCRPRPLPDGWCLRTVNPSRFDDELRAMYRVTSSAFESAWRYSPLPFDLFRLLYEPFRGRFDPRWVWAVDDPAGVMQGYFFTFVAGDVVIAKTLALHRDAHGKGISWPMVSAMHQQARAAGLRGCVHHLMHESAVSTVFGGEGSQVVRRYALYRKAL